jgi:hypothetical protein
MADRQIVEASPIARSAAPRETDVFGIGDSSICHQPPM